MVSPSTGFLLLDTRVGDFTITLPPISSNLGRVLTIKDQFHTFDVNSPYISTAGVDRFSWGSSMIQLTIPGETLIIVGANDYKWYMISPDRSNELTTKNLLTLSTLNFFSTRNPQSYGSLWADDMEHLYWNGFLVRKEDVSSLTVAFMSTAIICEQHSSKVSSNTTTLSTYTGVNMAQEQYIEF